MVEEEEEEEEEEEVEEEGLVEEVEGLVRSRALSAVIEINKYTPHNVSIQGHKGLSVVGYICLFV